MKQNRVRFLSFLIFFLAIGVAFAQSSSSPQSSPYAEQIRVFSEFAKKQMEFDQIPGMSVGFVKDGFVWTGAFGYADLENRTPARPDSSYRLGSISKPMTAVAVLLLMEKGKINLDAEVQTYVPYFPKKPWPITIRELLGHLGGISHYKNYDLEGRIKEHKNTRDAIAIFENFDLVAEPGTKYSYSSYGYNLLGAVIEGAAGQPYGNYMEQNIWKPLEMSETRMDDPTDLIPYRVRGYRLINGQIKNSEFVDMSSRFGAGGTRSTVGDLLKFATTLNDGKILSKETRDLMWTSMQTRDKNLTDYGMGWDVDSINGHFVVWHTGSQAETRTVLYNFPAQHFAVAVAINQEDVAASPYARRLFQLIFDEAWNASIYPTDPSSTAAIKTMTSVFRDGNAYFERYQKPLSTASKQLAAAFRYINQILNTNPASKQTWETVEMGRQPAEGEPFQIAGSYMASILATKPTKNYSVSGAIPFFNDYVDACKRQPNFPKELQFSKSFEQKLSQWNSDWSRTNTSYLRQLSLTSDINLTNVRNQLESTFQGSLVFPDLTAALSLSAWQNIRKANWERALSISEIAYENYRQSDEANAVLAVSLLRGGAEDRIQSLLKKSAEINPKGSASAGEIDGSAEDLAESGNKDEALRLLLIGTKMYPENADLYNSQGELYLLKQDKENAKNAFTKAVSLDPDLENAKEKLKELSQ
jgi:CubicO group peptidase (beta-lactamase class C family)